MGFEFFQVIKVDDALARWRGALAAHVPVTPAERRDLAAARGLALGRPVLAGDDVPGFDRSTMDGYAVAAADTYGASEGQPAYFAVAGEVEMGAAAAAAPGAGSAVRISTGGMMPPGADAVVMVEYCEELATGEIAVSRAVSPGENVIRRGEDLRAGRPVLPGGHRLRPQDLGILAAAGVTAVAVHRPPRVAIVATGDEIVPPDQAPGPGRVRDVNSVALAGMVATAGGEPSLAGIVGDDPAAMGRAFAAAAADADLLLVSGGSSVGHRDYVGPAIAAMGQPGVLAHGLALRPGKPTLLAVAGRLPVIGLPGHPASALVVFWLFGRPALDHLLGVAGDQGVRPAVRATLSRNLPSAPGREEYFRVALRPRPDGGGWLGEPVFGASGLIHTLVAGDGLVRVPHGSEGLPAGTEVDVFLFGGGW